MKLTHHFEVKPESPFDDDPLGRKSSIENLTRLSRDTDTPLVMTVTAPWGHGKTTFINMWQCYLKNSGFKTIRFDAWQNDYAEDPFVSFMGALATLFSENDSKLKTQWGKLQAAAKSFVRASPKIALNYLFLGGLSFVADAEGQGND